MVIPKGLQLKILEELDTAHTGGGWWCVVEEHWFRYRTDSKTVQKMLFNAKKLC